MAQKNRAQRRSSGGGAARNYDRPRVLHERPDVEKDIIPSKADPDAVEAKKDDEDAPVVDLRARAAARKKDREKVLAFIDLDGTEHYIQRLVAKEVRWIGSVIEDAQDRARARGGKENELDLRSEDLFEIARMALTDEAFEYTENLDFEDQRDIIQRVFEQTMKAMNTGNSGASS